MIGDGPLRAELEAEAEALGLGDRVMFTGRVERPGAIMRRHALGLLTSDVEGFPNVILEMLAAGVRRVVSTDCAGGLDTLPGVSVAAEATPEALADALRAVLDAPARRKGVEAFLAARSPDAFLRAIRA